MIDGLRASLVALGEASRVDVRHKQLLGIFTTFGAKVDVQNQSVAGQVVVNRIPLPQETVQALEQQYGRQMQPGKYWYDARCGAWGLEDGPCLGFILPGLNLAGPMPADISKGGTSIFINGREIHPQDQVALQQLLGVTYPGRYWLDGQGNLGVEGGGVLLNLLATIRQSGGSGKGGSVYSGVGSGSWVTTDGSGGVSFFDRNTNTSYTR